MTATSPHGDTNLAEAVPIRSGRRRSTNDENITDTAFEDRSGELCRVRRATSRRTEVRRICNFTLEVVERVETLAGNGDKTIGYVLNVTCGVRTERVEVDATRPCAFVSEVAGLFVEAHRERDLEEAIARSAVDAPTVRRITRTGWYRNPPGNWWFLHADGAIGASERVDGLRATLDDRLADYALPKAPAADQVAPIVREAVETFVDAADRCITLPLLAAVVRAPLGAPAHCVSFLVGVTGSGKTSLARFAASWFGPTLATRDAPTLSFNATANALEVIAADLHDVPVLVDDFLGTKAHHTTLERLLRSVTGGGRDRLRPDLGKRPAYLPGGTVIVTGEDDAERRSAQARTVPIVCSPTMRAPASKFHKAQAAARNGLFATAMAAYIRHLATERDAHGVDDDGMPTTWAKHLAAVRSKIDAHVDRSGESVHTREVDNVVELLAASAHFLGWTIQVGAFTETEARRHLDESWHVLLNIVTDGALDEGAQAVTMLADALASHHCHLTNLSGGIPEDHPHLVGWTTGSGMFAESRPNGPCVGYIHDDTIDLLPDALVAVIAAAQRRAGIEPNLKRPRLGRLLHEHGCLQRNDNRETYGIRRKISGRPVPVWPLAVSVVLGHTAFDDDVVTEQTSLLLRERLNAIEVDATRDEG